MKSAPFSPAAFARDTQEEPEFCQARLALFYKNGFILSGLGLLLAGLLFAAVGTKGPTTKLLGKEDWIYPWVLEFLLTAMCFALWRRTRRGALCPVSLAVIDVGGTLLGCFAFVAMGWVMPPYLRPEFYAMTSVTVLLAFRAAIVPSTPTRTAVIGAVAIGAIVVFALFYYSHFFVADDAPTPFMYASIAALIGSAIVAATTITSQTLFGLRQKMREAMQLGQYTLTEKIGEGGMGVVFKATHAMLRRPTAVKLLPASRSGGHGAARFEREVQLTSMLTHPNTIQVYDFGRTADGTFYYAMEYVDGFTLDRVVDVDGPQPAARVIAILAQVCGSLAEAHSIGLIHRDIKPENIMVCERGQLADVVKVLDFGLVKATRDADAKLSRAGTLVGTPLYMSPEALLSPDDVDARTDLYAVGAVGYFLVTGHHVFEGTTLVEIGAHHLHTPPNRPSSRLGAHVPADFEDVLLACLAKSPDERPLDTRDLRRRLLACADGRAWTEEQSHSWWQTHRGRIRDDRAIRRSGSGSYDTTALAKASRVVRAQGA